MEFLTGHQIIFFLPWIKKTNLLVMFYIKQKLGYAESNPSSDLNGDDVSAKLKILSSLCFNSFLNNNIHVEGIKDIDKEDMLCKSLAIK